MAITAWHSSAVKADYVDWCRYIGEKHGRAVGRFPAPLRAQPEQ